MRSDYAYRAVAEKPTKGCPRCGGKLMADPILFCINCSWEGETRPGTPDEIGRGAGDQTSDSGRYRKLWEDETAANVKRGAERSARTKGFSKQNRDARIRSYYDAGITPSVIAKMIDCSPRTVFRAIKGE